MGGVGIGGGRFSLAEAGLVQKIGHLRAVSAVAGARFTCFTSTKVQILTQKVLTQFTCFTSAKVQKLIRHLR